jgi:imidazolonepropionase-like amidohydrolase
VRATVRAAAEAGVEAMKAVMIVTPGGPEEATLAVIAGESERLGLRSITHTTSVQDTLAAVRAGTHVLMHTPHTDLLDLEEARTIAESGIPMVSTLGVFTPTFAEDNQAIRAATGFDNAPRFRDLLPYPEAAEPWYSAGQGGINARLFWDAGGIYAFGTDTTYLPRDSLKQELTVLNVFFSRQDLIRILTRNAAIAMGRGEDLGTLEPGKLADMVLVDGNPLADIYDLLDVVLVIRDGRVVLDRL